MDDEQFLCLEEWGGRGGWGWGCEWGVGGGEVGGRGVVAFCIGHSLSDSVQCVLLHTVMTSCAARTAQSLTSVYFDL